jgi:DNA-binding CsgD family transcriptional regulator
MTLSRQDRQRLLAVIARAVGWRGGHPDEAIYLLLEDALPLLAARTATAVMAVRIPNPPPDDPLAGFRPRRYFVMSNDGVRYEELLDDWVATPKMVLEDALTQRNMGGAGARRANRRRDLLPDGQWIGSNSQRFMEGLGLTDRLMGGEPLHPDIECHLVFDRMGPPDFSAGDRELLLDLLAPLEPLFERWVRAHGFYPDQTPLTPREREILGLLLGSGSEKEIALKLGLSAGTTHQYVVALYRKMGVRRRYQLFTHGLSPRGRAPADERRAAHGG